MPTLATLFGREEKELHPSRWRHSKFRLLFEQPLFYWPNLLLILSEKGWLRGSKRWNSRIIKLKHALKIAFAVISKKFENPWPGLTDDGQIRKPQSVITIDESGFCLVTLPMFSIQDLITFNLTRNFCSSSAQGCQKKTEKSYFEFGRNWGFEKIFEKMENWTGSM